jgi:fructokinase
MSATGAKANSFAAEDVILVAGEALFDLVMADGDDVRAHAGGGPFNTARAIARLQQPVAYLGRLSSDRFGRTLERMLAADGVRLDAVVHTDDPTTLALAELDASGSATYRFYERGTAATGLTTAMALAALPPAVSILHVGTLGITLEPVATAVEAVVEELSGGALVAVDPNCRPWVIDDPDRYRRRLRRILGHSHLLKVSEEDLAWLDPTRTPLAAARALLEHGPTVVLLTRGPDGAMVVTPSGEVAVPAPAGRVVDTVGAGDSFAGGFLAWWRSHGLDRDALADTALVTEATAFACQVAAITVSRPGADPPHLDELELPGGPPATPRRRTG